MVYLQCGYPARVSTVIGIIDVFAYLDSRFLNAIKGIGQYPAISPPKFRISPRICIFWIIHYHVTSGYRWIMLGNCAIRVVVCRVSVDKSVLYFRLR